jgi:hypothetical protein
MILVIGNYVSFIWDDDLNCLMVFSQGVISPARTKSRNTGPVGRSYPR